MKTIVIIFTLLITVMGCKKKGKEAEPITPPVCETKTKVFEGKWIFQGGQNDTINIVFDHNSCPVKDVNVYKVNGLGKVINSVSSATVNPDKIYYITSNELNKSATTSGVKCNWGIVVNMSCDYQGIGNLMFKK